MDQPRRPGSPTHTFLRVGVEGRHMQYVRLDLHHSADRLRARCRCGSAAGGVDDQAARLDPFRKEAEDDQAYAKQKQKPEHRIEWSKIKTACDDQPKRHKNRDQGMEEHGYGDAGAGGGGAQAPPDHRQERVAAGNISPQLESAVRDCSFEWRSGRIRVGKGSAVEHRELTTGDGSQPLGDDRRRNVHIEMKAIVSHERGESLL